MYTFYKEKENKGLGNYIYQTHIMGSVILMMKTKAHPNTDPKTHERTCTQTYTQLQIDVFLYVGKYSIFS